MASRGASLFAFFFCNEKKKGGFGAPPQESPHKPKGTDQTAKCGKMWPIKRKQGEKCYFSPCALKSPLTNSRAPFFLSVAVQSSTRVSVCSMIFQI